MRPFFHSIRWRVQAWHAVLLLGVILAFCAAVYRLAWDNQLRRADRNLLRAERELIRGLAESLPPSPATGRPEPFSPARLIEYLHTNRPELPPSAAPLFRGNDPGYAYFCLRDASGRILLQSPNLPADLAARAPDPATFNEDWRTLADRRESLRQTPEGLVSVFGLDLRPEREEIRRFAWSLGAAGLGVWVLGLLGGWWLAGRAIRPIRVISAAATRIADGNLDERISTVGTESELGQLGRVLNASFDRLRAAVTRERQFTADASHELRTPVTVLLAETQRVLKRERSPEEYRAALQTCQDTAARMRRLTESLLLLARQEAGSDTPRTDCDLAALLRETAAQLQPLAVQHEIEFKLDLQPACGRGDPAALAILATNLVANAIQHHDRPGGRVTLSTRVQAGRAVLAVRDDGPGIPPDFLPHVFERFTRLDPARTRGSGHAGLGLAIARTIAVNHGGTLTAANNPDRGACFTLVMEACPPAGSAR